MGCKDGTDSCYNALDSNSISEIGALNLEAYSCPEPFNQLYCLNNAKCFLIKIENSLVYNCLCPEGYEGQRCEFKDLSRSYVSARYQKIFQKAGFELTFIIGLIILVGVGVGLITYYQWKKANILPLSSIEQGESNTSQSIENNGIADIIDCSNEPTMQTAGKLPFVCSIKPKLRNPSQ